MKISIFKKHKKTIEEIPVKEVVKLSDLSDAFKNITKNSQDQADAIKIVLKNMRETMNKIKISSEEILDKTDTESLAMQNMPTFDYQSDYQSDYQDDY